MDETDIKILTLLQDDGRLSNVELAQAVELKPAGIYKRVKRLQDRGYINRFAAILNRERLGYDLLCFVTLTLQNNSSENYEALRKKVQSVPEILECYEITGTDDVLMKVVARERHHLKEFLHAFTSDLKQISRIKTDVVLDELKLTTCLPISTKQTDNIEENFFHAP